MLPDKLDTPKAPIVSHTLILVTTAANPVYQDFNPDSPMYAPHHRGQVILSTIGILIWLAAIGVSISHWGFSEVFRTYLVPYLWWVELIMY